MTKLMTTTSPSRLGTKAASLYLGGEETLRYWRYADTGPRSYCLGRPCYYDLVDLDCWISTQMATTQRGDVNA